MKKPRHSVTVSERDRITVLGEAVRAGFLFSETEPHIRVSVLASCLVNDLRDARQQLHDRPDVLGLTDQVIDALRLVRDTPLERLNEALHDLSVLTGPSPEAVQ